MAEVPSQSWSSFYWRFESNVNLEELSLSRFKRLVPSYYELTNRYKELLNNRAMYHPARASSDVASSLAPSPGLRTDASARSRSRVVVSSARRGVLRLESARCSIRPVVPRKVLRPRRKRLRCPSSNSSRRPAVITEDECWRR